MQNFMYTSTSDASDIVDNGGVRLLLRFQTVSCIFITTQLDSSYKALLVCKAQEIGRMICFLSLLSQSLNGPLSARTIHCDAPSMQLKRRVCLCLTSPIDITRWPKHLYWWPHWKKSETILWYRIKQENQRISPRIWTPGELETQTSL